MSSYVRKIKAGRIGSLNVTSSDYVGETGTIFYDESIGDLRLSDGVTPGGHLVYAPDLYLEIDGGNASTNYIAEIEVDGGGA